MSLWFVFGFTAANYYHHWKENYYYRSHDNFISFKIQNVHHYAIFVTHIIETKEIGRMLRKWTVDWLFSVRMYNLFDIQYSVLLWRFDLETCNCIKFYFNDRNLNTERGEWMRRSRIIRKRKKKRVREEWKRKQLIRFIKLTGLLTLTNHSITINNFLIIVISFFTRIESKSTHSVFNRRHFWLILEVHNLRRKKKMINDMQLRRTNLKKGSFTFGKVLVSIRISFYHFVFLFSFGPIINFAIEFLNWSLLFECTLHTLYDIK